MKNQKILVLEDHPLISMVIEDVCKDMAPHAQIHVATSLVQSPTAHREAETAKAHRG